MRHRVLHHNISCQYLLCFELKLNKKKEMKQTNKKRLQVGFCGDVLSSQCLPCCRQLVVQPQLAQTDELIANLSEDKTKMDF